MPRHTLFHSFSTDVPDVGRPMSSTSASRCPRCRQADVPDVGLEAVEGSHERFRQRLAAGTERREGGECKQPTTCWWCGGNEWTGCPDFWPYCRCRHPARGSMLKHISIALLTALYLLVICRNRVITLPKLLSILSMYASSTRVLPFIGITS